LKIAKKITQPSIPLPSVFSKIAGLLKNHYTGKHTAELHAALPPGTISHGDFKTGNPSRESANLYSPQLHAYAYALEHAAPGALTLSPVTKMGLLYFYPTNTSQQSIERIFYESEITWIEIEKNEPGFLEFIEEILELLESPEAPPPSPTCPWCNYSDKLNGI
jgi:hypothetical protein